MIMYYSEREREREREVRYQVNDTFMFFVTQVRFNVKYFKINDNVKIDYSYSEVTTKIFAQK